MTSAEYLSSRDAMVLGERYRLPEFRVPIEQYVEIIYPNIPQSIRGIASATLNELGKHTYCDPVGYFRGSENMRIHFGSPRGEWIPGYFSDLENKYHTNNLNTRKILHRLATYVPDLDFRYNTESALDENQIETIVKNYLRTHRVDPAMLVEFIKFPIPEAVLNKVKFTVGDQDFSLDIGPFNENTHFETRFGRKQRPFIDVINIGELTYYNDRLNVTYQPDQAIYLKNRQQIKPRLTVTSYTQALSGLTHAELLRIMRFPWAYSQYGHNTADTIVRQMEGSGYKNPHWWQKLNNPNNNPAEAQEMKNREQEFLSEFLLSCSIDPIMHAKLIKALGISDHLPIQNQFRDDESFDSFIQLMENNIAPNTDSPNESELGKRYANNVIGGGNIGPLIFMDALQKNYGYKQTEDPLTEFLLLHNPSILWR